MDPPRKAMQGAMEIKGERLEETMLARFGVFKAPWPLVIRECLMRTNGTAGIQAKARIQADLANLYRNPDRN